MGTLGPEKKIENEGHHESVVNFRFMRSSPRALELVGRGGQSPNALVY